MTADEDLTALEFLQKYKDKIAYVHVTWTWEREYYAEIDTDKVNWFVEVWGKQYPAAFNFEAEEVDREYSFSGTYEDALKFFEGYDCWDGVFEESDIYNGSLVKEYCNDNYCLEEPVEMDPDETYLNFHNYGISFWEGGKLRYPGNYENAVLKREEIPDDDEEVDE